MAKECTGETTTGVLKSKEVINFSERRVRVRYREDGHEGHDVRVRTQPNSFELKHDDASAP